jgi:general secretion pathway protein D
MHIKIMNYKLKTIKLISGLVFVFTASCLFAAQSVEELRQSLLEQERQASAVNNPTPVAVAPVQNVAVAQPNTVAPGLNNKGYLVSQQTNVQKPVSVSKAVSAPDISSQLYTEAKMLFEQGQFDEAKAKLNELLKINPMHVPALRLIKRIEDRKQELSFQDNVITAKEKMIDVDKAWLSPKKKEKPVIVEEKNEEQKTVQQKMLEEKTKQVIPEINFTDAHIRDVIKYLSDISGINIVIDEDIFPKVSQPENVPTQVDITKGIQTETAVQERGVLSDRITISLVNIPLIEALKYILSAKGLKYRIDEYAIIVSTPERFADVEMDTRYYHLAVGLGIFTEFAKRVQKEKEETDKRGISRGLKQESKITIKDVLEQSGVPFPPGSKVFLDQRTGTLIVRNTPQNLRLVDEVLRMLDITPFQVEIEARFVEVNEGNAKELGLEWMMTSPDFRFGDNKRFRWDNDTTDVIYGQYPDPLNNTGREGVTEGLRYLDQPFLENDPYKVQPSGNILSLSGILTQPEFRMIVHALDQSGFSNVLSAPKVTTLNNQQAQIEVVKEIIYPTEFELTPATTNDSGNIVTQPVVTPASWNTRDVGIILNVTPSVGADKKTINLALKPEVSILEKWLDYGIKGGVTWNDIPILQPIFLTKNVETNVVIHDGETVVLGGLIKEEITSQEDKIPLLGDIPFFGRMFRTNTETSQKTNLLIFVTANLLTPTGERIREQ